MHFSTLALAATLLRLIVAQTPDGFSPAVGTTLSVAYGTDAITPAGKSVPAPETANPPSIATRRIPPSGNTLLFMIDLDVSSGGTRVTNLHWFATGLKATGNALNGTTLSVPTDGGPGGAPYVQPSPPAGDIPHRYVFLLYEQPSNFAVPSAFKNLSDSRMGFSVTNFMEQAHLAIPLAANYIMVQNTTTTSTTTSPSTSGTATQSGGASSTSASGTSASSTSATTSATPGAAVGVKAAVGGTGMGAGMAALWLFGLL